MTWVPTAESERAGPSRASEAELLGELRGQLVAVEDVGEHDDLVLGDARVDPAEVTGEDVEIGLVGLEVVDARMVDLGCRPSRAS
jgi:hypothetical protein